MTIISLYLGLPSSWIGYCSVPIAHVQLFQTPWTAAHHDLCPSLSPRVRSNSCPLSRWCSPATSPSLAPFSSCLQSSPASGSFPMRLLFTSGGQSIGASASESVLPMTIQGWFPLGLTSLILQSKGLSRVCSNTTVQMLQFSAFFMVQLSHSYVSHVWLLQKLYEYVFSSYEDTCCCC